MAYAASQLLEEVTAHAQSDSLEDAQEICAEGTYFPNNLHTIHQSNTTDFTMLLYHLGQHVSTLVESSSGPSKIQILANSV